jgi:catechol 1,2-dioxygenase
MTDAARLRTITFRVVDAIKEVVRSEAITEDELHAAAAFLNRVGVAGVFPSLLDIAFAMTIMDRAREGVPGTRANLEGPEYRPGAPERADGCLFDHEPGPDAVLLSLTGVVTDALTGEPVAGAELDWWQADEHGGYDRVGCHLRGVTRSDADGRYALLTVLANDYDEHEGDPVGELLEMMGRLRYRAAHIHLKVRVDGVLRLTTQLFRGDSPYLDLDYVVGAVSDDLILDLQPRAPKDGRQMYEAVFDLALPPSIPRFT